MAARADPHLVLKVVKRQALGGGRLGVVARREHVMRHGEHEDTRRYRCKDEGEVRDRHAAAALTH